MLAVRNDVDYYQMSLKTSNRQYYAIIDPRGFDANLDYLSLHVSVLADMDAQDTVLIQMQQNGTGTAAMDINGASHFSGYLVA